MASLPELQARFAEALRGDPGPMAAETVDDGVAAAGRLRIYRNNSRAMFEGALERSYPVLRRRVGDDYFRQLARGYRERWPSRSGDLHWIGRDFPRYVAEVQAGTGYEWLAELATLEWAVEEALVASQQHPVGVEALAGLGPDALAEARLRLQPSLHCLNASVPVVDVWRANQPGAAGDAIDLAKGSQCVVVNCDETGLVLRELTPPALDFVRRLRSGEPIGTALEQSRLPLDELPRTLGLMFEAGFVTAVLTTPPEHES